MAKIVWTEEAERWLRDIHDYIASENPVAAAKVIAGIFEAHYGNLGKNPTMKFWDKFGTLRKQNRGKWNRTEQ